MFDSNLFLRTTGAGSLTSNESATGIAINGTPVDGLSWVIGIPKLGTAGTTAAFKLQHSTDNSTYTDLITVETIASVTVTSAVSLILVRRFATELKYVRSSVVVAGTSPDFGAVWMAIGDMDQWNTLQLGLPTNPVAGTSL